jgi:hypothetical protein
MMPHWPLLQVALPPVPGLGQGSHMLPHEFTLALSAHMPLQSCLPLGHAPSHAWLGGMHLSAQMRVPFGHTGEQRPLLHSALPPAGGVHGSHDVPQLIGDASLAH